MARSINLKTELGKVGQSQAELARHLRLSKGTVHAICNTGRLPQGSDEKALRSQIKAFMAASGATPDVLKRLFMREVPPLVTGKSISGGRPIRLRDALIVHNTSQKALAKHLGCTVTVVHDLCCRGRMPVFPGGPEALRERVCAFLIARGADALTVPSVFERIPAPAKPAQPHPGAEPDLNPPQEDQPMLLRKHTLTRQAREHFRVPRDPFADQLDSEQDVFLSDDIRYVRAAMRQTAKHGGMLAVVGESGAGKSTLVLDLQEWINTSGEPITIISPYVLGMGRSDRKTRPLVADDIIRTIFKFLAPSATVPQNNVARSARMHELLAESAKIGRRHVVLIEEAHDLATQTIKHLKRFYELQSGFRKLLSIILIGQTELEWKLSEHNPDVREVVQRCEMVKLPALDNHVQSYLQHKFARVDMQIDQVLAPDAVDEIRNRLRHAVVEGKGNARQQRQVSLCHPLAINNLVAAAMNEAVGIGAPRVTGALIAAAARS